jgi:hypothetical protein
MVEFRIRALIAAFLLTAFSVCGSRASATETITYTYDAKGRVVQVVRAGTVNNNGSTTYQYDKADNRKQVTATAPH